MMGMSNGRVFSLNIDTLAVTQEFSVQGEVVGFRQAAGEGVFIFTSFGSSAEVHLLDADRDGDDVVDGLDEFPDEPYESADSDGDGV